MEPISRKNLEQIRRYNLRLVADLLGQKALCARLKTTRQQVHQYIGPTPIRNIGESFARKVEAALCLPSGWLDDSAQSSSIVAEALRHSGHRVQWFEAALARIDRLQRRLDDLVRTANGADQQGQP